MKIVGEVFIMRSKRVYMVGVFSGLESALKQMIVANTLPIAKGSEKVFGCIAVV